MSVVVWLLVVVVVVVIVLVLIDWLVLASVEMGTAAIVERISVQNVFEINERRRGNIILPFSSSSPSPQSLILLTASSQSHVIVT